MVRRNVDREDWTVNIPQTAVLEAEGASIYVVHNLDELNLKPEAAGFSAVVYGHSHVPKQERKNGVLYFNPGSAGPRRFDFPVSIGKLSLEKGKIRAQIVQITPPHS